MKTKIGKLGTRSRSSIDLSHDVTTTSGFGFVQPLFCREMCPDQTITEHVNTFVRLQPLVKPTYGRLKGYRYDCFVKTEDIWHPWPYFLSGTTYSNLTSYIPTRVPSMEFAFLKFILCGFASHTFYTSPTGSNAYDSSKFTELNILSFPNDSDYLSTTTGKIVTQVLVGIFSNIASDLVPAIWYNFFLASFGYNPSSGDFTGKATSSWAYTERSADGKLTSSPNTPSNSDFVFKTLIANEDGSYSTGWWCVRLSNRGRNLRKIFLGLGYQINNSFRRCSLLKIFAFYKAYFDLFYPQRVMSWSNTDLFRALEVTESYNFDWNEFPYHSYGNDDDSPAFRVFTPELFWSVMRNLSEAYFTSAPDYVSSHITGSAISSSSSFFPTIDANGNIYNAEHGVNQQAHFDENQGLNTISRAQLRAINMLSKYVNIKTVAGGRIDKFLRSVYGGGYEVHDSNYLGMDTFDINISDVMNQAETSEGFLGEYAGQGFGMNRGNKVKCSANYHGFFMSLFCIVPDSKYAQAIDPNVLHTEKFDFYTAAFDGLTLVPSSKLNVYGCEDIYLDTSATLDRGSFGNIPIYSEYKSINSILNGDVSLASTRSSYLPFTLEKLMPYEEFRASLVSGSEEEGNAVYRYEPVSISASEIVNGVFWRYVGRYSWLGNYDRIFVNSGSDFGFRIFDTTLPLFDFLDNKDAVFDDNFIVHNFLNVRLVSRMLPMGESFDTGTEDTGDVMSVQHQ